MKKDKCPICGEDLVITLVESVKNNSGELGEKISSRCNIPYTIPCSQGLVVKYHYENVAMNEETPYYEQFVVYPYVLINLLGSPGEDITQINKFDNQYIFHFVINMPILNLPWHDPDKVRNKLNTFVVFS